MNWLDLFGGDFRHIDRARESERRSGPCDDDYEVTCPYVDMLPDETEHEEVSPLKF